MNRLVLVIICFNLLCIIIVPTLLINLTNFWYDSNYKVNVYNTKSNRVMRLNLDQYLKGVVAAEMPAEFSLEALKAQAVAARTYTLKKLKRDKLTTNSKTDQAWNSKLELLDQWGANNFLLYWPKISSAVEETKGIVLVYQGQLIDAVYHSTSGGYTESAVRVWGRKIPYLQSVLSQYEVTSPYYQRKRYYSVEQLVDKLGIDHKELSTLKIISRSSSGRVLKVKVGNRYLSGREFRKKLGLYSTNFEIIKQKNNYKIITSGYGHGVGMSQYGAQGMAQHGYNYKQILKHYYPQTELRSLGN